MRRTPWLGEKRLACQEGFCSKKLGGKTNAYISINALLPCAVPILRSTYLQLGRLPQVEIPNGAVQTVCGNFRCFQKILRDSLNTAKVNFQPDTQNSYLFTYNTFIKILYMFRALPCSSSGGLRRNYIYAASGTITHCRWLSCAPVKKESSSFFTGVQDSHLQRVTIPEAAYIQLRRRPPEDEQGNARNM